MLVHHPHDLGCVHSGTSAKGDNRIWLELLHLIGPLLCTLQRRVWCHFIEACMLDAHLV